jgi:hypothetical protein
VRPSPRPLLVASSLLLLAACSGAGVGCPGLQPLPSGYQGPRQDDPLSVRVSQDGIQTLNQAWPQLLALVAPGQSMSFPVACTKQSFAGLASITLADQGSAGCTDPSCGALDGQCTAADLPASVPVTFTGLQLGTRPGAAGQPGTLQATLTLKISTGKLYASTRGGSLLCGWNMSTPIRCGIDFDGARAAPDENTVVASLELFSDPEFSQRLNVRMSSLEGLKVCGTSGSLPPPACTDGSDLELTDEPGGCCPSSNAALFKDLLLQSLSGLLEDKLREQVDALACAPCATNADCPVEEDGRTSTCNTSDGTCFNAAAGRCPPGSTGLEGRLDITQLVGAGTPSPTDLSLVLGHGTRVDTGVTLGSRGGAAAAAQADCVPALPAPVPPALAAPDFEGAAPDGGFHVGLALTRGWLDQFGHALHQSGGLCLQVGSADVPQLTTGALRAVLPSLGLLAGPGDGPALVVLRPQSAPTFRLGAGTFTAAGQMQDPLITLTLPGLAVDVYGLIEDRQVRLFTATLDLVLPVSLQEDGCGQVLPVLGALDQAVRNPRFTNAEMLSEDPQALAALLPALISAAQPGLASALTAFTLPPLGTFSIALAEARGMTPSAAAPGSFERVALFSRLVPTADCPASPTPASLRLESARRGSAREGAAGWPSARIALGEAPAGTRWAWRLDGGPWSPWLLPEAGSLEVRHPGLLLQGAHRVELRSRPEGAGPSAPVAVALRTDLEPPRVRLERAGAVVTTRAQDSVAPAGALRFQYALGGSWSTPGPARDFPLDEVERAGGLRVRAEDPAGWTAEATFRAARVEARADAEDGAAPPPAGCAAVPPRLSLPGALLALFALRRRR